MSTPKQLTQVEQDSLEYIRDNPGARLKEMYHISKPYLICVATQNLVTYRLVTVERNPLRFYVTEKDNA